MPHPLTSRPPLAQQLLLWLLLALLPAQGLAAVLAHGFGALHFHAVDTSAEPAPRWPVGNPLADEPAGADQAIPHAHDGLERHHHHHDDHGLLEASRVTVDAGAAAQAGDTPAGASGALGQPIAPPIGHSGGVTRLAREQWPSAAVAALPTPPPRRQERPPRPR